jgi:two-component system, chemotaxis family, response regulator Rcp1
MKTVASRKPNPREFAPAKQNSEEGITILIVDDDQDCRMLIRDAISESKVCNRVFEVSDGREALDFLHQRGRWVHAPKPGLIYLDIEMPGMNGQEVLASIKANPNLRDIPVVMITGVSDELQMRKAAEAGANSYTLKPASAEQFLQTVLTSTNYWLTIHQYPDHHLPPDQCRR